MHRVKQINFGNNLEEIGSQSFNYSLDVDKIDLPVTFNKFGSTPFFHCQIDTIICRNPIPPVESRGYDYGTSGDYFGSAPSKGILFVPKESIKLYSEAPYWKDFKNIHGLDGVPAESIYLNYEELILFVGESKTITAKVLPEDTTDKTITWISENETIATISTDGTVTGVSVGIANITAACGNATATCKVTVNPVSASGITLNTQDMTLLVGQTGKLTATVTPDNTTDKTVIWESDNEAIAKVEAGGTVTAVSVGIANITATCGEVSATCKVTVNARPETPKQYVRKGNGKSCTFVVMMNLTDKELTQQGCRFAYGYTDTQGDEHILATSNHRYCHTSEQIYNDASNNFWVVAYWDKDNSIVTSVRRHLDGTTDDDFDQSILTNYLTRPIDSSDPDNWIRPTSRGAQISISNAEPTTVAIYNLNGVMIHCANYERGTEVSEEIILERYISNTYIITVQSGDIKSTKKIIIR